MKDLRPGEVLEVHTNDPAARVGVPAWCCLTRKRFVHRRPDHTHAGHTTTQPIFLITKKAN